MKRIAHTIALLHIPVIVAALAGTVFVSFYPAYAGYQMALATAIVAVWSLYGGCPFTNWENQLRAKYDPAGVYSGPCIAHYAHKHLGIKISEWAIRTVMYYLMAMSAVIYFFRGS